MRGNPTLRSRQLRRNPTPPGRGTWMDAWPLGTMHRRASTVKPKRQRNGHPDAMDLHGARDRAPERDRDGERSHPRVVDGFPAVRPNHALRGVVQKLIWGKAWVSGRLALHGRRSRYATSARIRPKPKHSTGSFGVRWAASNGGTNGRMATCGVGLECPPRKAPACRSLSRYGS
jgi:hypothetical protein